MKPPTKSTLWKYTLLTLILAGTQFNATCAPIAWDLAAGGNGHLYEAVYVPGGINWSNARTAALASGGDLVSITSAPENQFVLSLIRDDAQFWGPTLATYILNGPWLGGFQTNGSPESGKGWMWVTGEQMQYTNWGGGAPNNNGIGGDDKLHFQRRTNVVEPFWNDAPNPLLVPGYVIEYTPPILSIRVSQVEICWDTVTNADYQLYYRDDLRTNTWQRFGESVLGDGGRYCTNDWVRPGQPKRFYEVGVTNWPR